MSALRNTVFASAVFIAAASTAHAAIITTTKQTLTYGPQLTELNAAQQTFALFNSNLGTLQSIILGVSYGFNSNLTISNSASTSSNGTAQTESRFILSDTASNINTVLQNDLNTLATPSGNGGFSSYTIDATGSAASYTLAPGGSTTGTSTASNASRSNNFSVTDTTASDLSPFAVKGGGNSTAQADTFTRTLVANTGGNTSANQVTTATAVFSIQYTYDNSTAVPPATPGDASVPEPASLMVLGAGLLGTGIMRRRSSL